MTEYPNREHQKADEAARRRALAALDHLVNEVGIMRRRIEAGRADGDDGRTIASLARDLTQHVAVLEALRDVRYWHEADLAEAQAACRFCGNGTEAGVLEVGKDGPQHVACADDSKEGVQ